MKTNEIKVIKLSFRLYQVEAGRKAIVIPAKNKSEAIKKACRYLGIHCNKIIANSSLKALR